MSFNTKKSRHSTQGPGQATGRGIAEAARGGANPPAEDAADVGGLRQDPGGDVGWHEEGEVGQEHGAPGAGAPGQAGGSPAISRAPLLLPSLASFSASLAALFLSKKKTEFLFLGKCV